MRVFPALALSLLLFSNYCAQSSAGRFSLSGSVIDSVNSSPIPGVNVIVYSSSTGKQIAGAACNDKGIFSVKSIPENKVKVSFSVVGYRLKSIDTAFTQKSTAIALAPVKLSSTLITVTGVEVKAQRPMIEYFIDKQVVNMEKVPGNSGSVTDALKNTGAIDVEPGTNKISMRGRSGLIIQIDGKPMPGAETLLSQMPASSVDKIEIISSPGAKEDAEGDAGILNIITKKSERNNYNGSVSLSASTQKMTYGTLIFNYRKDKFNIFSSISGGLGRQRFESEGYKINYNSISNHIQNSAGKSEFSGRMGNLKLGLDYDMDDLNSFSVSGTFFTLKYDQSDNTSSHIFKNDNALNYTYRLANEGNNLNSNYNFTAYYRKKFNKEGHEITADAYYTRMDSDNDNDRSTGYNYMSFPELQNSLNNVDNKTLILKTDYVNPSKAFGKIETGYRFTFRDRNNDYQVFNFDQPHSLWNNDTNYSNIFNYKESIHALYLSYSNKILIFDYIAGLRYEGTIAEGDQRTGGKTFSNSYASFFPSFYIAYKLSPRFQVLFNTARRINRPRMEYINPFTRVDGPNSYSRGNPLLDPTYVNLYELKFSPILNLFHTNSNGRPYWITTTENDSVTYNSVINCGRTKTYGLELTLPIINDPQFPIKLPKWLNMINVFFSVTRVIDEGVYNSEDYSAKKTTWNVSANSNFTLWYDVNLMVNANYRPKISDKRYIRNASTYLGLSLSRDFFDRKFKVALMLSDLLNSSKYRTETFGSNFYSDNTSHYLSSRGAFLSLTYNFNDFKPKRERNVDDGRDKSEGGMF